MGCLLGGFVGYAAGFVFREAALERQPIGQGVGGLRFG